MRVAVVLLTVALNGCASTARRAVPAADPSRTVFQPVGVLDLRIHDEDDYRSLVRPGDLLVNYLRAGTAVQRRLWLHAILPYGHSMLALDPHDPAGLFEVRYRGARRRGFEELRQYSFTVVYRLERVQRLNLDRLREFAAVAQTRIDDYRFLSWLGIREELTPDRPAEIEPHYVCSTAIVAAFHYAGVTLDVAEGRFGVVTPMSVAHSPGTFNRFALPAGPPTPSPPCLKPARVRLVTVPKPD